MKKSKVYLILIIMVMLLIPSTVYGVGYQADKTGDRKKANLNTLFSKIQEMGTKDGTLCVKDVTKIDCHMSLNTEWGTAAMLCISDYGLNSNNSTTGNETGIKNMQTGPEYVAAVYANLTGSTAILAANPVYKNNYTEDNTRINGDGLNFGNGSMAYSNYIKRADSGLLNYTIKYREVDSYQGRAVVVNVGGPTN